MDKKDLVLKTLGLGGMVAASYVAGMLMGAASLSPGERDLRAQRKESYEQYEKQVQVQVEKAPHLSMDELDERMGNRLDRLRGRDKDWLGQEMTGILRRENGMKKRAGLPARDDQQMAALEADVQSYLANERVLPQLVKLEQAIRHSDVNFHYTAERVKGDPMAADKRRFRQQAAAAMMASRLKLVAGHPDLVHHDYSSFVTTTRGPDFAFTVSFDNLAKNPAYENMMKSLEMATVDRGEAIWVTPRDVLQNRVYRTPEDFSRSLEDARSYQHRLDKDDLPRMQLGDAELDRQVPVIDQATMLLQANTDERKTAGYFMHDESIPHLYAKPSPGVFEHELRHTLQQGKGLERETKSSLAPLLNDPKVLERSIFTKEFLEYAIGNSDELEVRLSAIKSRAYSAGERLPDAASAEKYLRGLLKNPPPCLHNAGEQTIYDFLERLPDGERERAIELMAKIIPALVDNQSLPLWEGLDSPARRGHDLVFGIKAGDGAAVDRILGEGGVNLLIGDRDGCTALHCAAERGEAELVGRLLGAGAEVNALDNFDRTPLHAAAMTGRSEICERLLTAGGDPGQRDLAGDTPAELARHKGHEGLVAVLRRSQDTEVSVRLG